MDFWRIAVSVILTPGGVLAGGPYTVPILQNQLN